MQGMKEAGLDMQETNAIGFDMTQCKVGDKLLHRNGEVAELSGFCLGRDYPYQMNNRVTVDGGGFCYADDDISEHDIVGFADVESKPVTKMILTTDSAARKQIPITTGVLDYFPLAIAEVAKCSKACNEQHHPGEPLHWDKSKSTDHADCIARHLVDRDSYDTDGIRHSVKLAWRALAYLQIQLENEQKGKSA
jgi:hypothetical protein